MKTKIMCSLIALCCAYTAQAQMAHYYIGSSNSRSEVARVVRALPDGSSIIAGYIYDLGASNEITNADNLLLRVGPDGTIIWQQEWGRGAAFAPNNNDLLYDMIIAQNGDIICVGTIGRNQTYPDMETENANTKKKNTAAIYRFDINGNLLYENFIRDVNGTDGGEVFESVCELDNGDIVAVGGHDARPAAIDGMISVFDNTLTNRYNETIPASAGQSDHFLSVIQNGNDVYITGHVYIPGNTTYDDLSLANYTPGTTSGTLNWLKYYDITYTDAAGNVMPSDWPGKIFLRNNSVVITGRVDDGWNSTNGAKHFIFRSDMNGTGPQAWLVNNGSGPAQYCNQPMIFPLTDDDLFMTQVPSTGFTYNYNTTGSTSSLVNVWASYVNSLNGNSVAVSTEFYLWNNESVQSLDVKTGGGNLDGYLYMAGNAAPETHNTDNDIYFAIVNNTLRDATGDASCPHEATTTIDMQTPPDVTLNITPASFSGPVTIRYATPNPDLSSSIWCGTTLANKPARPNNNTITNKTYGMYPNPASEYITATGYENANYQITNMLGQQVLNGTVKGEEKIVIESLPNGLYIITLTENGNSKAYQFSKN